MKIYIEYRIHQKMDYLDQNNPNLLKDINSRKEFVQFKKTHQAAEDPDIIYNDLSDLIDTDNLHFNPQNYQSVVANFINPNTPYNRMAFKWEPGMGKSAATLNVAMRFIDMFQKEAEVQTDLEHEIGSVFIIGFTEEIFKKELLSYPEFGYISREEIMEKRALEAAANSDDRVAAEKLQDFMIRIRKRLTNRKERGFFRFFGYKAFVNRIFMLQDFKYNITELTEPEIRQKLQDGSLKFNEALIKSFKNSLIICDEIHVVYNSLEKNNWGVALQMVLDYDPTIKAIFLSATLLNTSPTEIIDLANLMLPPGKKLNKTDFFEDQKLKRSKLPQLAEVFKGRISYIQDSNPDYFADQKIVGESIRGIDYLKFIRCPMTPFHYKTYKEVYSGVLAQDAQYLMDIAFPNPAGESLTGLYKTNDIKRGLSAVSESWFAKYGFKYTDDIITGHGLLKQNLKLWSTKMYQVLCDTQELIKDPWSGKILIYHDVVHVSGVMFLEQILQQNGFIDIDQHESADTLCAVCGITRAAHPPEAKAISEKEALQRKAQGLPELPPPNNNQIFGFNQEVRGGDGDSDGITLVSAMDSNLPDIIKLTKQHTGTEPWFPISPCNTTVALIDEKPVGYITVVPDGKNLLVIPAIICPQRSAANVLIHRAKSQADAWDADLVTVVEVDDDLDDWNRWGFQEYDREDNKIWLRWNNQLELEQDDNLVVSTAGGGAIGVAKNKNKNTKAHTGEKGEKVRPHVYTPARYIMAHSAMDKSTMLRNIERMNSPDNLWGYTSGRIIVGSKIIKQSYNFTTIRHVKVTARPSNIAIFIQIIGRARRKNAHLRLPPNMRDITVNIYTSCLPNKELSHEEIKYREKVEDYKEIQVIERELNRYAIDAGIMRDIIEPGLLEKSDLGALEFQPAVSIGRELNLATFNAFHAGAEIKNLIHIIKRAFIQVSPVWELPDLWRLISGGGLPWDLEFDVAMLDYDNFLIALDLLIYSERGDIARAAVKFSDEHKTHILDLIYNDIDKRIQMPNGTIGYIQQVGKYYTFIPQLGGDDAMYAESPFRIFNNQINQPVNIAKYLKESSKSLDYAAQRTVFYTKYENTPFQDLAGVVEKFSVVFHQMFAEEIIAYVFNIWTKPGAVPRSEMHEFYYKILYYYDKIGLIIWASTAKSALVSSKYNKYVLETSKKLKNDIPGLAADDLARSLAMSQDLFKKSKSSGIVKADPNQLPIGHYVIGVPKFYTPDEGWYEYPDYIQDIDISKYVENDIIIGYYEKSHNGLNVKFKLRSPIQNIKTHKDSRMIEKGSVCSSSNKAFLTELAKKLGITVGEKTIVPNICQEIENKLLNLERIEREKGSNIKWFYSFWEPNPQMLNKAISSSTSSIH